MARPVCANVVQRRPRRAQEGHAEGGEVVDGPAEIVGGERAAGAALRLVGSEHEVVDDELGPAGEQLGERPAPVLGVEAVLPLHRHPRQLATSARELVAAAGELLLLLEQGDARRQPLLAGSHSICCAGHQASSGSQSVTWLLTAPAVGTHR